MEEEWMRDRALLRDLLQKTPDASPRELAQATGRSVSWVKKWRKRLCEGDPHDQELLCARSRAHHAPYFRWDVCLIRRIVEMRFSPPENLKRVPGPRALLYYLPRDPELQAAQVPLPRSSRTIWKILHTTGCLVTRSKEPPHPNELRKPLEEIQMDFKDVGSVSPEQSPQGKRQHVIEVCNFLDAGTSIALLAQAREDFHEQTAMEAVITFLRQYGCPRQMTFDRDPRWVGSVSGRDFPSPLRRLLLCLGITPHVCPPHRPDKNELVAYCTPSAWLACFCVFVSALLRRVFIGWREDRDPMIIGPIHGKQTRPPPAHDGLLAHSIGFGGFVRRQQTAFA